MERMMTESMMNHTEKSWEMSLVRMRSGFLLFLVGLALLTLAAEAGAQTSNYVTISNRDISVEARCGDSVCVSISIESTGLDTIQLITGAVPTLASFSLDDPDPTSTFPLQIVPADTLTFTYCFRPTTPGTTDNELLILQFDTLTGALPALDTIRLSGTSLAPSLAFNPADIDFGNVTIGETSCRTVEIRNDGNEPIDLSTLDSLTFPFSPNAPPAVTLGPGENIQVEVCFSPIVAENFASALSLFNGDCRDSARLTVRGEGLNTVANIGPVLQVIAPDFDTTLCGTTKCRTLTFRNVGTTPLNITQLDALPAPFTGSLGTLPITIAANDERSFTVCYEPSEAGSVDSAILNLVADNRVSLTIGTLFDVSGSMRTNFGTTDRITAANSAGRSFLANLINDPGRGVLDEGAVFQFGTLADISLLEGYSTVIPDLQNAVPSTAPAPETCLYEGVLFAVNSLATRNQPGRRVLVVLADGANNCNGSNSTLANAIAAAQAAGVRVYTIGIGAADAADLTALATQTGGTYSEALSPAELLDSYQEIANTLSRDQANQIRLDGRSVAPLLSLSTNSFQFGEVMVGEQECQTLTVANNGDAPLENVTVQLPNDHYTIVPAAIPNLLPGENAEIQICFEPGTIRELNRAITFTYRRCEDLSEEVDLEGIGFDSVTISIDGLFSARPGSAFRVPIQLLDNVLESYNVDSLTLTLRYNKTMLFPANEAIPYPPSGGVLDVMTTQENLTTFGQNEAFMEVTFRNGRLVNTSGPRPLGSVEFLALHGNARQTPIEIVSASFADGNPRVGFFGRADFQADSLCFHDDRLVDGSALFGPVARLVSRSSGNAVIAVDLPREDHLQVGLYDLRGALRATITDGVRDAGRTTISVPLNDLTPGAYLLHAATPEGGTTLRIDVD